MDGGRGPVFIVGMPRSGTTVMRSILNAHPSLAITQETHFLNRWAERYGAADLADPAAFAAFWDDFCSSRPFQWIGLPAADLERHIEAAGPRSLESVFTALMSAYAESTGKPRLGEKTPDHHRHVDTLFSWFPDARVVFMVRDPRAVVASHRAISERWARHSTGEIAAKWRKAARNAERWRSDPRVLLLRYEDFVVDPEAEVRRVCEHVGEAFVPTILAGRGKGRARAAQEVTTSSVEAWRSALSPFDLAAVEHVGRDEMTRLGYALSGTSVGWRGRVALRSSWLALRIRRVMSA